MKSLDIPTFYDVLDAAHFWRTTGDRADLSTAAAILEQGRKDHPYAIPLWDELALVYQKLGEDRKAGELLQKLRRAHGAASEETLARFGQAHKKLAEAKLRSGQLAAAVGELHECERLYGEAFELRRGFYPRINQLTARFRRAAVLACLRDNPPADAPSAEALLEDVRREVAAMLRDPSVWAERQPDDAIWSAATQAEANVLLGQWEAARRSYRAAIERAAGQRFYLDTMRDHLLTNLLPTYQMLGLPFDGELAAEGFFPVGPKVAVEITLAVTAEVVQ